MPSLLRSLDESVTGILAYGFLLVSNFLFAVCAGKSIGNMFAKINTAHVYTVQYAKIILITTPLCAHDLVFTQNNPWVPQGFQGFFCLTNVLLATDFH